MMTTNGRSVLITDAATSREAQFEARKRRYVLLMSGRLFLLVAAATAYPVSVSLAVALLALSVPLPWMAVLIANDAPPRRSEDTHRLGIETPVRQLESRSHVIVDADGPFDVAA